MGSLVGLKKLVTYTGRNACDSRGSTTQKTASKPTSMEDVFLLFAQLDIPLVNCGKPLSIKLENLYFFEIWMIAVANVFIVYPHNLVNIF